MKDEPEKVGLVVFGPDEDGVEAGQAGRQAEPSQRRAGRFGDAVAVRHPETVAAEQDDGAVRFALVDGVETRQLRRQVGEHVAHVRRVAVVDAAAAARTPDVLRSDADNNGNSFPFPHEQHPVFHLPVPAESYSSFVKGPFFCYGSFKKSIQSFNWNVL